MCATQENAGIKIGRIHYKMQPEKPLDEALKWYNEKKNIQRDTTEMQRHMNKADTMKVVEVSVQSGHDLFVQGSGTDPRSIMPFFSY